MGELFGEVLVVNASGVKVGLGPLSSMASGLTVKAGHYVGTSW